MKVVFCCPTVVRPHDAFLAAVEASCPALDKAGLEHQITWEVGNPYISAARATMLRRALDAKADVIVFLDHDLSWAPNDLLTLIEAPGDVVAGTYRFKDDKEDYMGSLFTDELGRPLCRRTDKCVKAHRIPAGFLKITKEAVGHFMKTYPQLVYGEPWHPHIDLFNHGAHGGLWYGEDYAFARNWVDAGGDIWIIPNLDIDHHQGDKVYRGNFHKYLERLPPAKAERKAA